MDFDGQWVQIKDASTCGRVAHTEGNRAYVDVYDQHKKSGWSSNGRQVIVSCDRLKTIDPLVAIPTSAPRDLSSDEQQLWLKTWEDVYHETNGDPTAAELAAFGAVEKIRTSPVSLKSVGNFDEDLAEGPQTVVAGWGLIFTDANNLDLQNTYFDKMTEVLTEYYQHAPLWFEHGQDPNYGATPIGYRTFLKVYPRGIWVEHSLDQSHPLYDETIDQVENGALSYSSDSISHFVDTGFNPQDGELSVWPLAGWSLVSSPAEPALGPVGLREVVAAVKSAVHAKTHHSKRAQHSRRLFTGSHMALQRSATGYHQYNRGIKSFKEDRMDPEYEVTQDVLDALADFIGLDPGYSPEDDLAPAVTTLMGEIQASGEVDPALAPALGLDQTATADDVVTALEEVVDYFNPENESDAAEDTMPDMSGMEEEPAPASASRFGRKLRKGKIFNMNRTRRIGHMTQANRSSNFKARNININRGASKPGIADIILGHLKGDRRAIKGATKASMSYTDNISGGYTLNREISAEILKPLYATEVVMAAGAEVIPMDGIETLTVRKMTSGVDAYWGGESQAVGDSNPLFGIVQLSLRELVARVRIPNRMLQNSVDLESKVREDIIKRMRLKMDQSFLFGTGAKPVATGNTGQEPLGIMNVSGVTKTSLGTNGARPRLQDLTAAILRLESANVEASDSWAWVMHPRTKTTFMDMTDTTGVPLLRASWGGEEAKELLGYPFYVSTQVPVDQVAGSASNTSSIIVGDWQYAVVGMGMDVEIVIDTSRYVNERETLIQATALTDFGVYYPSAFQVISAVLP